MKCYKNKILCHVHSTQSICKTHDTAQLVLGARKSWNNTSFFCFHQFHECLNFPRISLKPTGDSFFKDCLFWIDSRYSYRILNLNRIHSKKQPKEIHTVTMCIYIFIYPWASHFQSHYPNWRLRYLVFISQQQWLLLIEWNWSTTRKV